MSNELLVLGVSLAMTTIPYMYNFLVHWTPKKRKGKVETTGGVPP